MVGACHRRGRLLVSAWSSARSGSGARCAVVWVRVCSVGHDDQLGLPAGLQAARDQTVLRLAGHKRPLGPVGLVAGALHGKLGGPGSPGSPVGDLGGGGQGQRDLLGAHRCEQPLGDRVVQGGCGHRAAAGRGHLIGAGGGALVGSAAAWVVAGRHRPPAATADQDALAQCLTLAGRPGALVGGVGLQPGLVGQEPIPAEVAGMMVIDDDRPLRAWQLHGGGAHRAVRADHAAGVEAAEHVAAGVGGVGQDAEHAGVGQRAPAQLPGPDPTVGAQREAASLELGYHPVGRPAGAEAGEHIRHRVGDLLVRVDHGGALVVIDVADRQWEAQLAALGSGPLGALQAAGEHVQLCF